MKKTIYNRFPKDDINGLRPIEFEGRIVVISTASEAKKAVDFLLTQPLLGVDTETRPSFRRGDIHKVSLLQVSSETVCFLFRLNIIGLPDDVVRLLENTRVPMIGLSWHDDILSLKTRKEFLPGRFIDLQSIVGEIGIEDLSLQKLYANIFGRKISKSQRLTNWDADVLREKQLKYAATDAWACLRLYREICRLKETGDYELVVVPTPVPPESDTLLHPNT